MRMILVFFGIFCMIDGIIGQDKEADITIVHDVDRETALFMQLIKNEINALLENQYVIDYHLKSELDGDLNDILNNAMTDGSEVIITLGFGASDILSQMDNYPIPSLAGISLERSERSTTGINNYNYVQSPFNIERDLDVFQEIYPFKKLGVFADPLLESRIEPFIASRSIDFERQFVSITDDPSYDISQLDDDVDAIYFLPNLYSQESDEDLLIELINEKGLPSFSLIGRTDVEKGVFASISPSEYISVYARRIALNVMKILEGQNPKDFPVQISGIEEDFVINASTMEQLDIYPPFDVLSQASMIDIVPKGEINYTIETAVAHALENNLSYLTEKKNVDVQNTEIGIAQSNLRPNGELSTSMVNLDGNTAQLLAAANQLTPQTEWTGNFQVNQVLYSEPAKANVSIQRTLLESEKQGLLSLQLDLVLDVCSAYLRLLQAQANLNIQNNNVQTTLKNLNIAKTKANIGTVSLADVYGFESQLALNKISLNDAGTALEQSMIAFNALLNIPLDRHVILKDVEDFDDILFLSQNKLQDGIKNHYDFLEFADFLIHKTYDKAPELKQLDHVIAAQERSLLSNKRSLYQPQLVLQGNLDKVFGRYGTRISDEQLEEFGVDPLIPTWNIAVSASLPIFQGQLRNKKIQKEQILIDQLQLNRSDLELTFASNIRISLENLANSYNEIQFSQQAETSSNQYLKIVQDLYREGVSNIVTLLDAQNSALSAQLGVVSSRYQFIIDALTIERLTNNVYMLATPEDRQQFIIDYFDFITEIKKNE